VKSADELRSQPRPTSYLFKPLSHRRVREITDFMFRCADADAEVSGVWEGTVPIESAA
jgi:hypothetical protein